MIALAGSNWYARRGRRTTTFENTCTSDKNALIIWTRFTMHPPFSRQHEQKPIPQCHYRPRPRTIHTTPPSRAGALAGRTASTQILVATTVFSPTAPTPQAPRPHRFPTAPDRPPTPAGRTWPCSHPPARPEHVMLTRRRQLEVVRRRRGQQRLYLRVRPLRRLKRRRQRPHWASRLG